jgi:hypothetical protein
MNTLRKVLTIIGLGLLIWSLGLVWPELDLTIGLGILVAIAMLASSVGLALRWRHFSPDQNQANKTRPRHPSRPIAVH